MLDHLDHVQEPHLEKILTHLHREAMGHVFTSVLPTADTVPIGKTVIYNDADNSEIRVYLKTALNNLIYYRLNASGEIIVDGEIEIGSYFKADDTNGMWLGAAAFGDAPFSVNLSGDLVATSATLTGAITATSGSIGGWTISTGLLYAGDAGTRVGMAPATYPFYAGANDASTAPFRVNTAGNLVCTNITATGGTIGGFTIGASSLTAGAGAAAVGLAPATYPFYAGNTTAASAPFRVDTAGAVTATSGAIGGWTLGATTLSSTNITIDSGNELIKSNDYVSGALGAGWNIDANTALIPKPYFLHNLQIEYFSFCHKLHSS